MSSIPASDTGFGTREFAKLLSAAIHEYLRHKDTIDPDLPTGAVAAIMILVGLLDAIIALNEPGPQ